MAERALILFYSFLLLFVPLVRGLEGHLPIELTARGARWQETAAASGEALTRVDAKIDQLGRDVERLGDAVVDLQMRFASIEKRRG